MSLAEDLRGALRVAWTEGSIRAGLDDWQHSRFAREEADAHYNAADGENLVADRYIYGDEQPHEDLAVRHYDNAPGLIRRPEPTESVELTYKELREVRAHMLAPFGNTGPRPESNPGRVVAKLSAALHRLEQRETQVEQPLDRDYVMRERDGIKYRSPLNANEPEHRAIMPGQQRDAPRVITSPEEARDYVRGAMWEGEMMRRRQVQRP